MRAIVYGAAASCLIVISSSAEPIKSRQEFHATPYGTLALNVGASSSFDSRYNIKNYSVIADGAATLPLQSTYCFVINHYRDDATDDEFTYVFQITRWFAGYPDPVVRKESRTFSPTNDRRSVRMPDYCLDRGVNVIKVEVQTRSTEGPDFDHKFSFEIPR